MAIICPVVRLLLSVTSLRARCVMVQNRNRMVKALASADMMFTITAAPEGPLKSVKIRPTIINSGAPGGCPTSNLYEVVINSPQSQKLAVGSMVSK